LNKNTKIYNKIKPQHGWWQTLALSHCRWVNAGICCMLLSRRGVVGSKIVL